MLPTPESDGAPPLQFEAIDQAVLVDPFQETSARATAPTSAKQQPSDVTAANVRRTALFTDCIPRNGTVRTMGATSPPLEVRVSR